MDAERYSVQDLIKAVRSAGREYDARLLLQSKADDTQLSAALKSVAGVRSPGSADKDGVRLVTFLMDQRTMLGDLQKAASAIGAEIQSPTLEK